MVLSALRSRGFSALQGQLTKGAGGGASPASASTSSCPLPISVADGVGEGAWGGQPSAETKFLNVPKISLVRILKLVGV